VTAVLVQYETKTGRVNNGVATTFLAHKHPHDGEELPRVPIFIRKSQFKLPTKTETPIIMVGPGN
jgi:NADPH-ferrihemoprotein reductase